ncbi:BTAD domain-containing putative transcriptional regulator [Kribbella sp. NPDC058245]|uniref:AfsR/SARP family transcriptional regulator n=1 Tax=Kribbella sp. NPDC058245 TaxID=3346399 RepID=UPI0036E19823
MEFRLLGTLEVHAGGAEIKLVRRQERLLLAVLLLRANELTPTDQLIDLIWPDDPPADARGSLQVYVSRLRKAGIAIDGGRDGYAVRAPAGSTDLDRFRVGVAQARALPDPAGRGSALRTALELWRGELLPEVVDRTVRDRLCVPVEEERRGAVDERIQADLAAGLHTELLDELPAVVEADPTREITVAAWMTALHLTGRRQDALDVYADVAARLSDQFGLEPAPALRRLYLAILRNDPVDRTASEETVPRELPVDISMLLGRDELLADAVQALTEDAATLCLWGAAGVGKSAAATRIGHLVADAFPDGQLFARLQDVGGAAVPAEALLGSMLRSIGVAPRAVPEPLEERVRLFRDKTAELALLVVLDDALDAETVEQLLPSGPNCAAVVTSRRSLPQLKKAIHRQVLPLDSTTSNDLLTKLIGRTVRDPAVVATVAVECVGLPLALRIIGSRFALSSDEALPALLGALADDEARLDWMVAGDLAVRTSLDRSLTLAEPRTKQLLARLSLVGVTEFPAWVAAPLLDHDELGGHVAFEQLVDLGLVELVAIEPFRRYKMHALVRSYAAEQLSDPAQPRQRYFEAVHRVTALANAGVNHGWTVAAHLRTPATPVLPEAEGAIEADAIQWFDVSWSLIDAAARSALSAGQPELAGAIALLLTGYLGVRELRAPRNALLQEVAEVVAETGPLELSVRLELALWTHRGGAPADQWSAGGRLRELAESTGSLELQARAELQLAAAALHLAEYDDARMHGLAALALTDRPGGPGELRSLALRRLVHIAAELHDYEDAVRWGEQVVELAPPSSNVQGEARLLLGEIYAEIGSYEKAEEHLTTAAATFRALSSDGNGAQVHCVLATTMARQGKTDQARALLDLAKAVNADAPSHYLRLRIGLAEADIAMTAGDFAAGRRIRRELIEVVEARGDRSSARYFRELIDTDPRDPANQ